MSFLKSRGCAALVLAVAVVGGTLFGSHRSLMAAADRVAEQNEYVMKDLKTRASVGHNFYTVAARYLPESDPALSALSTALKQVEVDVADPEAQDALKIALDGLSALSGGLEGLTEQDDKYIRGFQAQLRSVEDTLSRDPYNDQADNFNREVLGSFPASVLGKLTGVDTLPVYR